MAKNDDGQTAVNAASYADAAVAIYMQRTFHLDKRPQSGVLDIHI
jgi:hypothetical protein